MTGLDDVNDAIQAELDAIRPTGIQHRIEPSDWLSTAEMLIRQTLTECQGKDQRILNLTLLCRYPFAPDQTEAKTIWYSEIRRQMGSPESVDIEPHHVGKGNIPKDEWAETARTIIRDAIEKFSPYSKKEPGQWSDDTRKLEAFFLELRRKMPFEMDPDEIPYGPSVADSNQTGLASYHRDFQAVWYQACAQELGFIQPVRVPTATNELVPAPAKKRPQSSEQQKTLF